MRAGTGSVITVLPIAERSLPGPEALVRLAWLSIYDRGHEFTGVAEGSTPTHRLLGAAELQARGHRIDYLNRGGARSRRSRRLPWRPTQLAWVLRHQREFDAIVATHEAAALPALAARRLGLLRRPVLVMTVAAAEPRVNRLEEALEGWALRGADVLTVFARAQVTTLRARLGPRSPRIEFCALGVDVDYFRGHRGRIEDVVLAVGTNPGKDYPTLVRALRDGERCLIVTDADNQEAALAALGPGRR